MLEIEVLLAGGRTNLEELPAGRELLEVMDLSHTIWQTLECLRLRFALSGCSGLRYLRKLECRGGLGLSGGI